MDVKIVRIKNRLESVTRDILINFKMPDCDLPCELQLSIVGKFNAKS